MLIIRELLPVLPMVQIQHSKWWESLQHCWLGTQMVDVFRPQLSPFYLLEQDIPSVSIIHTKLLPNWICLPSRMRLTHGDGRLVGMRKRLERNALPIQKWILSKPSRLCALQHGEIYRAIFCEEVMIQICQYKDWIQMWAVAWPVQKTLSVTYVRISCWRYRLNLCS